jgi:hypothetical protein
VKKNVATNYSVISYNPFPIRQLAHRDIHESARPAFVTQKSLILNQAEKQETGNS